MTLELIDITKTYHTSDQAVPVLGGVNLKVEPGELVALVGASGSGKSTLLSIAGLLGSPSSGTVSIDGSVIDQDERNRTKARRAYLAFAFQQPHLMPQLTANENVELMLRMATSGDRRNYTEEAAAALRSVGLGERAAHYPKELSGGEQQRVAIARALAVRPKVLLADEPTGSLDDDLTGQILGLLSEVADSGIAVLLASHDPLAVKAASRTYRLVSGALQTVTGSPSNA